MFSLITLYDGQSQVICKQEKNENLLFAELEKIKTGGKTNIISALKQCKSIINSRTLENNILILTDGKFGEYEALNEAHIAFKMYAKQVQNTTVIDAESGVLNIGMASKFAEKIGANYTKLLV